MEMRDEEAVVVKQRKYVCDSLCFLQQVYVTGF